MSYLIEGDALLEGMIASIQYDLERVMKFVFEKEKMTWSTYYSITGKRYHINKKKARYLLLLMREYGYVEFNKRHIWVV